MFCNVIEYTIIFYYRYRMSAFETNETLIKNTNILIAVIVVSGLGCIIAVLTVILLALCVCYYKKRRNSMVHSPNTLKVAVPAIEASKLYVVESLKESGQEYDIPSDSSPKNAHKINLKLPTIVVPRRNSGQLHENLQTISKPMVPEMEKNHNYHQLRTDEGNVESPDSASSPTSLTPDLLKPILKHSLSNNNCDSSFHGTCTMCRFGAVHSHTSSNSYIPFFPNKHTFTNPTSSAPSSRCSSTQSSVDCERDSPVPPKRHESLNHCSSLPNYFMPRTQSDTQIGTKKDSFDHCGPIYSEPNHRASPAVKIVQVYKSNINLVRNLGMGQFGLVYLGETINLSQRDLNLGECTDKSQHLEVAVKFLHPNAPPSEQKAFEKEIKYMSRLRHKNVVQLIAVCLKEQKFILMEYMQHGDLHSFLQRYDSVNMGIESYEKTISYNVLVNMSLQIADAMKYLASCRFIHRDLATRNCLVGENYVVKVADFGLSRNLYDSCYYKFHGSAMLPIRWMANECFFGRFSEKTDIWAYGVTMWEIFTLCKRQPYYDKDDEQIIQETLNSCRNILEKPECCKPDIYEIMKKCWQNEAEHRANFKEIYNDLLRLI